MRLPNMYILGSGFSKAAGLPLGTEIFQEILSLSQKSILYENIVKPDLDRFLEYTHRAKGKELTETSVLLEDFISYLDIEHYLKLKGKDHWSVSGNRSQLAIRNMIAQILHRAKGQYNNWDLYLDFGVSLQPGDIVISFNYDTIVEDVLDELGKRYVFGPDEWRRDRNSQDRERSILILKLHGSLDWYSISSFEKSHNFVRGQDQYWEHKHPIFSFSHEHEIIRTFPYLDNKDSNLSKIYRIRNIESVQVGTPSVTEAPYIVSPSYSKIVYLNEIVDLWYGLTSWGNHCSTLTIIGFSLPEHDEYTMQVIYNIVENYKDQWDLQRIYNKPPLRLVDFAGSKSDEVRLKKRYPFLDFTKIDFFRGGFSRYCILTAEELAKQEIEP